MDDIQLIHRQLLKFCSGESTDVMNTLDALRSLEKTTMTVTMLKETKLGHTVGKLRKHENEMIADIAKTLVRSWKSMAQVSPRPGKLERKSSNMSNVSSDEGTSSSACKAKESSSSATNGVSPSRLKGSAPRSSSSLGPLIPPGLDKIRATVRTKLKELLETSEGGNASDVAMAIEIAMAKQYNMGLTHTENKKEYMAKFRQLSFNLKKNGPLREDLLQDMVSPEQLINMTADELATEEKRNEINKLRDDAFQRARLDWADANEDKINAQCGIALDAKGLFTCGRCKGTKTSNTQKQTRSADEPMTVFVQCHGCGNRWKC